MACEHVFTTPFLKDFVDLTAPPRDPHLDFPSVLGVTNLNIPSIFGVTTLSSQAHPHNPIPRSELYCLVLPDHIFFAAIRAVSARSVWGGEKLLRVESFILLLLLSNRPPFLSNDATPGAGDNQEDFHYSRRQGVSSSSYSFSTEPCKVINYFSSSNPPSSIPRGGNLCLLLLLYCTQRLLTGSSTTTVPRTHPLRFLRGGNGVERDSEPVPSEEGTTQNVSMTLT